MSETLDKLLHGPSALPVLVKADGTFATAPYPPAKTEDRAPESIEVQYSGAWDMPDVSDDQERDMVETVERETGWKVLTGYALGGGPAIMDNARRIAGGLAERILEEPGLWAVASVEMYPPKCEAGADGMPCADYVTHERCEHADYPAESQAAGWVLIHKEVAA